MRLSVFILMHSLYFDITVFYGLNIYLKYNSKFEIYPPYISHLHDYNKQKLMISKINKLITIND